jgi:hypothetical protein
MRRWAIVEKEAYAIVISCERLDCLLQRPDGFSLYPDHHNLLYVFNPYGRNPSVSAHTAAKLIRWALRHSSYTYTIEHVPGPENVCSDMLTRWAAPSTHARISAFMVAPLSPSLQESFEWPQAAEIRHAQDADLLTSDDPDSLTGRGILLSTDGLYRTSSDQVWIPSSASELQLRICVVSHTGLGGHRGFKTTLGTIQSCFSWPTINEDVQSFCNSCLHCRSTIGGDRTTRPLGEAIHATLPNEVIHFDFLFMGPSDVGYKYVLLIKDDLSSYLWLVPTAAADAASVVDALTSWFADFGTALVWVSDQGSHFKNRVIDGVRRALR